VGILTTGVDPAFRDGLPAAKSRSNAIETQQIFCNIVMPMQILSIEMQVKIQNNGTPVSRNNSKDKIISGINYISVLMSKIDYTSIRFGAITER
jgi:hypothetical protein